MEGMITNVYGPHNPVERRVFIRSLWKVQEKVPEPDWIIGGEFNIITSLKEKKGGRRMMEEE